MKGGGGGGGGIGGKPSEFQCVDDFLFLRRDQAAPLSNYRVSLFFLYIREGGS